MKRLITTRIEENEMDRKMRMWKASCWIAVLVLALGGPLGTQAWAVSYTVIDLNPSGFDGSEAYGTNGTQQVGEGWGEATTDGYYHALLWNGSAAYVDLNPSGFDNSYAYGISGTQQVG